jgi:hypothetical protein
MPSTNPVATLIRCNPAINMVLVARLVQVSNERLGSPTPFTRSRPTPLNTTKARHQPCCTRCPQQARHQNGPFARLVIELDVHPGS